MEQMHIPFFMRSIVAAALIIQIVCALINVWWKISTHTAAIGGVAGALFVFSEVFRFNPVWWFCLVIGIAGSLTDWILGCLIRRLVGRRAAHGWD
jgi:Na+/H+ antiporter NhaC